MDLDLASRLKRPDDSTIVLLVLDGLGGLPRRSNGFTELEAAETPNMDELVEEGTAGLQTPVAPGVTPGSGPGHLGLFGYDPLEYRVGRGVLSGLGIGYPLEPGEVAARGNFCRVDGDGFVTDRRAGRISTETNEALCEKLRTIDVPGVDIDIETVKEHRFLIVFQGEDLSGDVEDTDPHETGRRPNPPAPRHEGAESTSEAVSAFLDQVDDALADDDPANMVLLRGFSQLPDWPTFESAFGLDAACIANYPMYRGVARLVGMDALPTEESIEEKFAVARDHWDDHDFFFIHEKRTDSSGEDGDFDMKMTVIEEVDRQLPQLLELDPDVLVVTGDHSTPSAMGQHSWHPVPVFVWSDDVRPDEVERFGETYCRDGELGPQYPGRELMPLAVAHAGRFDKFGA